jgi:hypothetical protein
MAKSNIPQAQAVGGAEAIAEGALRELRRDSVSRQASRESPVFWQFCRIFSELSRFLPTLACLATSLQIRG